MELIVKEADVHLDKALADLTELSRSQANGEIKKGAVLVNDKTVKTKYAVKVGGVVACEMPKEEVLEYTAESIPLDIIYGDDDVAMVSEPQGMMAHPSVGHTSRTLVNALMYHVKDLSSINGAIRSGIMHCIDKDTSGLLMIVKNDKAHNVLAAELEDKESLHKYVAIVHGNTPNDRGIIEASIGHSERDRKKQAMTAEGKPAVTHFKVLGRFGNYTLIELILETGRAHQIRVHIAYTGYPVAGDPLYGPRKTLEDDGQFLHTQTLGFTHPTIGETLTFTAEAPVIFKETLGNLRSSKA